MKILFVIPELSLGGSERQLLLLAGGLEAVGHDVVVAVLKPAQRPVDAPSELDIRMLNAGSPHGLRAMLAVSRTIQKFRPDVVHSCLFGFDLWTNLAARIFGVKCIVSTRRELATWRKRHHVLWQSWANAMTDVVITNSLAAADYTCATERHIERGAIYRIPNIFEDATRGDTDKKADNPAPVILNVANFWAGKGQADLVGALAILRETVPDVTLWLVGEGPEREQVEALAASMKVLDAVRFCGRRDDIADLMQQADVYAHASHMESSPNALLEAMGAGTPTVGYAVGGVPELLDGGELGLLVDAGKVEQLAEGIACALTRTPAVQRRTALARDIALDRHSLTHCVQWHEHIYQRRTRDPAHHQQALRIALYTIGDMKSPSTRYRSLQYIPYLQEEGYEVRHFPLPSTTGGRWSQAFGLLRQGWIRRRQLRHGVDFDLLMVQKGLTPARWKGLAQQLAALDKPIIYDIDDAIYLTMPVELPGMFRKWQDAEEPNTLLALSTCTVAGNDYLAAYARQRSPHVEVVPSVVDLCRYWDRTWRTPKAVHELKLVWTGQRSTLPYLNAILPALDRVAADMEEDGHVPVTLRVICDDFEGLEKEKAPGLYFEEVLWDLQNELDALTAGDIGLMPLPNEDWAKGKCAFKAIQYMAMGIPVIASSVGVNAELVRHDENGFLSETADDFCSIIKKVSRDPARMREIAVQARATIAQGYSLRLAAPKWLHLTSK